MLSAIEGNSGTQGGNMANIRFDCDQLLTSRSLGSKVDLKGLSPTDRRLARTPSRSIFLLHTRIRTLFYYIVLSTMS